CSQYGCDRSHRATAIDLRNSQRPRDRSSRVEPFFDGRVIDVVETVTRGNRTEDLVMNDIQGDDSIGAGDEQKSSCLVERDAVRLSATRSPARDDLLPPDVDRHGFAALLQVGVEEAPLFVNGISFR